MENKYNEYNELLDTGYSPPEETSPEDEFFHSIYISGIMRTNHIGITEEVGKLQVRGVQYNLNDVNFIITHVKPVLVKNEKVNNRDRMTCFSYQNTKPWIGNDGHICPTSRDDRDNTPSCKGCRGEIIVSGILCEKNGTPMTNDGKPIFVFIRGKGIKSPNVYEYLDRIAKMDIDPPIFPDNVTLEKMVAKNKRHVTNITITTVNSKHGIKSVFALGVGERLKDEFVREILKIQKKTIVHFNDKFDRSNKIQSNDSSESNSVNEYTPESTPSQSQNQTPEQTVSQVSKSMSFDDIVF